LLQDWEKDKLRKELKDAYAMLEELGPVVFWGRHHQHGKENGTILQLDYPVRLKSRDFSSSPHMKRLKAMLDARREQFRAMLTGFEQRHGDKLRQVPMTTDKPGEPHWTNDWLPGLDAAAIYSFIADRKPRTYFEVGSGNSTKFARKAISDYGLSTRIVSVDPQPRAEVDAICDEMHRTGFEDFDLSRLDDLQSGDVVFIDNSHRAFPNSDVTVFFMEALGRLPGGCLYGLHDIFLPWDYQEEWCKLHFFSEQYLLASYLFGGADGDEIVLAGCYVSLTPDLISALDPLWNAKSGIFNHGGSFWMERRV
jgi:hypothetical protein